MLGGWDSGSRCSKVNYVDIKRGMCYNGPKMLNSRAYFAATATRDCIVVCGGISRRREVLDECEYFEKSHGG